MASNSEIHLTTTIGAPKVPQLEKRLHHSNSAARGHIAFKFCKMVLCDFGEAAELSKPTKGRIQNGGRLKMADMKLADQKSRGMKMADLKLAD